MSHTFCIFATQKNYKMYNPEFMKEAIALSNMCMEDGQGGPFGAVVVKDGKIIARGRNSVTSHNDPTAHAEVMAIREACKVLDTFQLTGCDLYASSEPCPMCFGAIYWARPDHVYFAASCEDAAHGGFDDCFIYDEMKLPISEYSIPTEQHDRDLAKGTFDRWLEYDNKIEY